MPASRKSKILILQYKFLHEECTQVENEFNIGCADINYYLSKFRKRLDNSSVDQVKKFDKTLTKVLKDKVEII